MTKVEAYVDILQEMLQMIPAYPGTPAGDRFEALSQKSTALRDDMSLEERQQLDAVFSAPFYAPEDHDVR